MAIIYHGFMITGGGDNYPYPSSSEIRRNRPPEYAQGVHGRLSAVKGELAKKDLDPEIRRRLEIQRILLEGQIGLL